MKIGVVPSAKEIFEQAARQGRKAASTGKKKRDRSRELKRKESTKVGKAQEHASELLIAVVKDFPNISEMNPFLKELISKDVDLDKLKKALGHIQKLAGLIRGVGVESKRDMFSSEDREEIIKARKKFFARMKSFLDSADKSLEILKEARWYFTELPEMKSDLDTIVLSGFPNVGKTTLLNSLCGSKAKIASYAFTTKKINLGKFTHKYLDIQVVDCPGLLDRRKLNPIEGKAVAALKHLSGAVIFVIDASETCGYTLEQQLKLLENIKEKFMGKKIKVVLNKCDLASEEQIEKAEKSVGKDVLKRGEGGKKDIRENIAALLFQKA